MTRAAQIALEIERLQAQILDLRRELDAIAEAQRLADLDALIARLPPEVLTLLRQDEPQPGNMKRLVPRGLAISRTSGGFVERSWTRLRGEILARLAEQSEVAS